MVIDSIQVVHCEEVPSAPGGVAQVRESAAYFTRFAKASGAAMFLVGHVTKDGTLAGPKVLEHIIDCSIMLEAEGAVSYTHLRSHETVLDIVCRLLLAKKTTLQYIPVTSIQHTNHQFHAHSYTSKPLYLHT